MAEEYKLCVDCVLSNLISMLVTSLVQLTDVNINRQRQHGRFRKIKINRTIVRIVVKSSFCYAFTPLKRTSLNENRHYKIDFILRSKIQRQRVRKIRIMRFSA